MPILSVSQAQEIAPFFQGRLGQCVLKRLMQRLSIDQLNQAYDRNDSYHGPEFAAHIIDDLGIRYQIGSPEHLNEVPTEEAFIAISNHPYGGLDGLIMVDLLGHIRPDFKIIANQILNLIKTMNDSFISVVPTLNEKRQALKENIAGIKIIKQHLMDHHPLGVFPSGAVSDYHLRTNSVGDRPWQESMLRLIQKAQVPILPIRFFNLNSNFFYFLGLIDWRIRTLRLPTELCNKRGRIESVGIGRLISVKEQSDFSDLQSFGNFLREKVYDMPLPTRFQERAC